MTEKTSLAGFVVRQRNAGESSAGRPVLTAGSEIWIGEYGDDLPRVFTSEKAALDACGKEYAPRNGASWDWIPHEENGVRVYCMWTLHPTTDAPLQQLPATVTPSILEGPAD
jgi:hypothetical protein